MATTLILMRHGKPEEGDYPTIEEDAVRPLSEEGKETQIMMGEFLKEKGYDVSLVLSSPLIRARESGECICDVFQAPMQWDFWLLGPINEKLVLEKCPDPTSNRCVVIVGHDPYIAEFANRLCGTKMLQGGMVKSGAAVLEMEQLKLGTGKWIDYFTPEAVKKQQTE